MQHLKDENWFKFLWYRQSYHFPGMVIGVVCMGLITGLLVLLHDQYNFLHFKIPSSVHTVLGLVTGLLLVFRTNTAYDRWWEGRKQLGLLVNTCRTFAVNYSTYFNTDDYPKKAELKRLIVAYVWALKMHLREQDFSQFGQYIPERFQAAFTNAKHKPNFILLLLNKHHLKLLRLDLITPQQMLHLEGLIEKLADIQGACERIRNTPIPIGYGLQLKRILFIYLVTLPIGFINDLHWIAIPTVMLTFFAMVGIELIGEEIEDPFGTDPNDLPFDDLSRKIKDNVYELLESKQEQISV